MHEGSRALEDDRVGQFNVARIAVCLDSMRALNVRYGADDRAQWHRCLLADRVEVSESHLVVLCVLNRYSKGMLLVGWAAWPLKGLRWYDSVSEQMMLSECGNSDRKTPSTK